MNQVQVEQKSYAMPPQDGFTVAHFLTVADVERSLRFYETVFGGRIASGGDSKGAPGYIHEIRLSAIPCIKPKLDYRRVLVDKIGEQAVLQYEAEAAKGLPDMGTPRLLVVNIVPANPSLLGKVGTMYKGFKKELFG